MAAFLRLMADRIEPQRAFGIVHDNGTLRLGEQTLNGVTLSGVSTTCGKFSISSDGSLYVEKLPKSPYSS